jgi:hypothetical protein
MEVELKVLLLHEFTCEVGAENSGNDFWDSPALLFRSSHAHFPEVRRIVALPSVKPHPCTFAAVRQRYRHAMIRGLVRVAV